MSTVSHAVHARPEEAEPLPVIQSDFMARWHQPFQQDLIRVDPQRDGWTTEAFSEQATAQLKKLEAIIANQTFEAAAVRPLLHSRFACTALQPPDLQKVKQDGQMSVCRGNDQLPGAMRYRGADGFVQALQRMLDNLPRCAWHAHFKLFRVETIPDGYETTSYFQLGGITETAGVQVNATWRCRWTAGDAQQPPRLVAVEVTDYEHVVSAGRAFLDRTETVLGNTPSYAAQLRRDVNHWGRLLDRRLGMDIVATHGLALGDVDGDGLDDLLVCEPGGLPNRLYVQKPDGTLRDVSAVAGIDFLEPTRAALLVDLDNDGDADAVLAADRLVVMLENDGYGRFRQRVGFRTSSLIVSLAAADYNQDGSLDVYACGYYTMEDAAESAVGLAKPIPYHDANNGGRNLLLENQTAWRFVDVTDQVGLNENNSRFSLAACWEDYDNDGDQDLYVANDYGRNCLYRNEGGRFRDVAAVAGVEDISAGMSVSWGDYNADGLPDIYVSNMFSSAGNRITYQRQFKQGLSTEVRKHFQRHARGNTLFENVGDGTFRDVSEAAGVTMGRWAWGSQFGDLNNDGWEDLLIMNGMITQPDDTGDL